jgi:hypothetical protein
MCPYTSSVVFALACLRRACTVLDVEAVGDEQTGELVAQIMEPKAGREAWH